MTKELIFVYNADSGSILAIKDYFHKIISPKTYDCNLCALTYDMLGMKSVWKETIEKTGMKTTFMHKDELKEKYSLSYDLPVILVKDEDNIKTILAAQEINRITILNELIMKLNKKLSEI